MSDVVDGPLSGSRNFHHFVKLCTSIVVFVVCWLVVQDVTKSAILSTLWFVSNRLQYKFANMKEPFFKGDLYCDFSIHSIVTVGLLYFVFGYWVFIGVAALIILYALSRKYGSP